MPVRYVQSCGHCTSTARTSEGACTAPAVGLRPALCIISDHVETIETKMPLIDAQRVRVANLRLQFLQVQRRRDFLVAAILLEDQRQHQQQRRHDVGEALVIAACHSWSLRHSHARADARITRRLQVLSAHGTEMFRDMVDRVAPRIEKSQDGKA